MYRVFHHKTRDQRWLSRIKYDEEALKNKTIRAAVIDWEILNIETKVKWVLVLYFV